MDSAYEYLTDVYEYKYKHIYNVVERYVRDNKLEFSRLWSLSRKHDKRQYYGPDYVCCISCPNVFYHGVSLANILDKECNAYIKLTTQIPHKLLTIIFVGFEVAPFIILEQIQYGLGRHLSDLAYIYQTLSSLADYDVWKYVIRYELKEYRSKIIQNYHYRTVKLSPNNTIFPHDIFKRNDIIALAEYTYWLENDHRVLVRADNKIHVTALTTAPLSSLIIPNCTKSGEEPFNNIYDYVKRIKFESDTYVLTVYDWPAYNPVYAPKKNGIRLAHANTCMYFILHTGQLQYANYFHSRVQIQDCSVLDDYVGTYVDRIEEFKIHKRKTGQKLSAYTPRVFLERDGEYKTIAISHGIRDRISQMPDESSSPSNTKTKRMKMMTTGEHRIDTHGRRKYRPLHRQWAYPSRFDYTMNY